MKNRTTTMTMIPATMKNRTTMMRMTKKKMTKMTTTSEQLSFA